MRSDPWKWQGRAGAWDFGSLDLNSGINHGGGRREAGPGLIGRFLDYLVERYAPSPWSQPITPHKVYVQTARPRPPLYQPDERVRRDATVWTLVQGVLAPLQFAVFLVSLGLVLNYLATGSGYESATVSVIIKTLVLYTIMITGAIWEKAVFGKYLFARPFFWEDMVSMVVIALHTAYVLAVWEDWGTANDRMILALVAYAAYAINAGQFLLKFRAARHESIGPDHFPHGHAT